MLHKCEGVDFVRELNQQQIEQVSGGVIPVWIGYVGAAIIVGNAIDILYNAAGAFREGYNANDKQ